ncbi:MAG: DUF4124 domain-containing protein [Myxococcota bacterium]
MHRLWLMTLLLIGFATPVAAELFKCKGPGGRTIFTDQKEQCPGADPFVPDVVIHKAEPSKPAASTPAAPAARERHRHAVQAEESQAMHWRQKKTSAEKELAELSLRRDWLKQYVTHCNRGGYVTTRDDAGIKQTVDCRELRREFEGLDSRTTELQAYLDEGLRDECRKAGCLPGWIRD